MLMEPPEKKIFTTEGAVPLLEAEAGIAAAAEAMRICPKCHGAGWLRRSVPNNSSKFLKPEKCTCRQALDRAKRRRDILVLSSLPQVRDNTFKTFNSRVPGVQLPCKAAFEYAQNPDGWLVLTGPSGCGKTHLAAAIANACFEADMVVLFISISDLLEHLRATFSPTSKITYDEQFARMRTADLLVLDDLGTQHSTEWAKEKLFQLINYRYNQANIIDERTGRRLGATVITSHFFDLGGIEERIRSRLKDTHFSKVIQFGRNVQDYRPHKKQHS